MARSYIRRKINGACRDCGRSWLPTRMIQFWVNGMLYRVCRECERAYPPPRAVPIGDQAAEVYRRQRDCQGRR